MKRLFRSSKPEISPLPPPPAAPPPPPGSAPLSSSQQHFTHTHDPAPDGEPWREQSNHHGVSVSASAAAGAAGNIKKSSSGLRLHDGHLEAGHGADQPQTGGGGGGGAFKMFGVGRSNNQGTVTPFPVDSGRMAEGIKRRVSRKDKKSTVTSMSTVNNNNHHHQAPSLAEMRMSQQQPSATPQPEALSPMHQHQHQYQGHGQPQQPMMYQAQHQQTTFMSHVQAPSPQPAPATSQSTNATGMHLPPPPLPSKVGRSRGDSAGAQSSDSWTPYPPQPASRKGSDPTTAYHAGLPMPPPPGSASSATGRYSPSQQQLFLPPGAQPPSPQTLRPVTPTRLPSSLGHSQTSLHSLSQDDIYGNASRAGHHGGGGRDRGYSSASASARGAGSDHEGSSHGHGLAAHQPVKLSKGPSAAATGQQQQTVVRSPLANAYTGDQSPSPPLPVVFPTPQPLQQRPQQQAPPSSSAVPTGPVAYPTGEDREKKEEKPKGRFWGMSFGGHGAGSGGGGRDKKGKSSQSGTQTPASIPPPQGQRGDEDSRRGSVDVWAGAGSGGIAGGPIHQQDLTTNAQEADTREPERGRASELTHRMLGLNLGGHHHPQQPQQQVQNAAAAKDVNSAIQILCAHPDPTLGVIYDVCDRINHSESPDSVCKEAARALRKQFKHGNEAERFNAARIWLFMMKNVNSPSFRAHATSKKFIASLDPILTAAPAKRPLSPAVHAAVEEIVADLTWHYGGDKGCEALGDLWREIKRPHQPDNGVPLADDHLSFRPYPRPVFDQHGRQLPLPESEVVIMPDGFPHGDYATSHGHSPGRHHQVNGGRQYADLPSHSEDMQKLQDECNAAREAARVLSEALVFTRPDELDDKPIIQEFYRTCVLAYESLSNQMGWAQAEAERSRERTMMDSPHIGSRPPSSARSDADANRPKDRSNHYATMEEQALGVLLEAHAALTDVLKQHDDLERMARDEKEMKEVRERSKNDTRMDKNAVLDASGNLMPPNASGSSRPTSPAPAARHPRSPLANATQPLPAPSRTFANHETTSRSRTPSPDNLPRPRIPGSPGRPSSPLRQGVVGKAAGPRPLPQPGVFRQTNASDASLQASAMGHGLKPPSKQGSGSSADGHTITTTAPAAAPAAVANQDNGADEDGWTPPTQPSRKALGKRRAVVDHDNHFNPDDMFLAPPEKKDDSGSDESITADDVHFAKPPVKYAYDAYQEKLEADKAASSGGSSSSQGHSSSAVPPPPRTTEGGIGGSGASSAAATRVMV